MNYQSLFLEELKSSEMKRKPQVRLLNMNTLIQIGKKEIEFLLNKYQIDEIESALIEYYLEEKFIHKIKNVLLKKKN